MIATIPGALFGVLLDKYMENFRNAALIGVMLIVIPSFCSNTGCIPFGSHDDSLTFTGDDQESIARFTFLISAPIILGDGLYHAKGMINTHIDKAPFFTAMITAAVVGVLSIKFLLNYLKKKGFGTFAVYRFVFGAFVIAIYFLR